MSSISSFIRYYFERMGLKFRLRSFIFYDFSLPREFGTAKNKITIKRILSNELQAEHVIGWLSFDQAKEHLLNSNFQLFVAFHDGLVVGSYWLEINYAELNFFDFNEQLAEDTIYVTHLIVAPEKRGLGIAEGLLIDACRQAQIMSKRRIVICCVPENLAVRKTISRMGWNNYLIVRYFRFAFFRIYLCMSAENNNKFIYFGESKTRVIGRG
jgi:predicted GNAT superfamily acetyltransferase